MTVTGAIGFSTAVSPGRMDLATGRLVASRFATALVLLGANDNAARGPHGAKVAIDAPVSHPVPLAHAPATDQACAGLMPWARSRRIGIAEASGTPAGTRRRQPRGRRNRNRESDHG